MRPPDEGRQTTHSDTLRTAPLWMQCWLGSANAQALCVAWVWHAKAHNERQHAHTPQTVLSVRQVAAHTVLVSAGHRTWWRNTALRLHIAQLLHPDPARFLGRLVMEPSDKSRLFLASPQNFRCRRIHQSSPRGRQRNTNTVFFHAAAALDVIMRSRCYKKPTSPVPTTRWPIQVVGARRGRARDGAAVNISHLNPIRLDSCFHPQLIHA